MFYSPHPLPLGGKMLSWENAPPVVILVLTRIRGTPPIGQADGGQSKGFSGAWGGERRGEEPQRG